MRPSRPVIGLGDLRKLLRVSEEDEIRRGESDGCGVGERKLASLVDEDEVEVLAVLVAREQPCGAADEPVLVGHVGVVISLVDEPVRTLVSVALVDAGECSTLLVRAALNLGQQVLDRGVAWRGDADAPSARERGDDHPCPAECLACTWRSLDGQNGVVETKSRGHERVDVLSQFAGRHCRRLTS